MSGDIPPIHSHALNLHRDNFTVTFTLASEINFKINFILRKSYLLCNNILIIF
jgi:hypothetical protein